jgi:hypothetical protein
MRQRPGSQPRELGDEPAGDGRCQQRLAGRDHAHGIEQPISGHRLDQEAAGAGAERVVDVLVEVEGGQHENPRPVAVAGLGGDLPGRLDAVHDRHAHVHEHHVGA